MKEYMGKLRDEGVGGQVILVIGDDGLSKLLRHIVRHSPDGFNWGYGGSGPADTALSILTDCVGRDVADAFYQRFKSEFVEDWKDSFEITENEITEWLDGKAKQMEKERDKVLEK